MPPAMTKRVPPEGGRVAQAELEADNAAELADDETVPARDGPPSLRRICRSVRGQSSSTALGSAPAAPAGESADQTELR